jgi:hypothetical protein
LDELALTGSPPGRLRPDAVEHSPLAGPPSGGKEDVAAGGARESVVENRTRRALDEIGGDGDILFHL